MGVDKVHSETRGRRAIGCGADRSTALGQRAAIDVPDKKREPTENDVAFTVGLIALAAKMAKADGVVTKDEVKAFKTAFKVSDAEMKQAARVFNLAKQDVRATRIAPSNS